MLTEREVVIALIANDPLIKSDVVVLLEGDGLNRIPEACRLLNEGYAPTLVFSGGLNNHGYGGFPYEVCLPEILKHGVSEAQIIPELHSLHTRQQAEFVIDICEAKNWNRFILVASHYHQYRAFLTFLKVLTERNLHRKINMINAPARPDWFEDNPWGRRIDLLQDEFKKIDLYKQSGHISSYQEAIEYFEWKRSV